MSIASKDDLTIACLASIEVPCKPNVTSVRQFKRSILITVRVIVPEERGFCCSDSVKEMGRNGACRPHLSAHRKHRDVQAQHRPDGTAPWASSYYQRLCLKDTPVRHDFVGAVVLMFNSRDLVAGQD